MFKIYIYTNNKCDYFLTNRNIYVVGGNQRELARAKNMKKDKKKAAAEQENNKGLTLEQRKQR